MARGMLRLRLLVARALARPNGRAALHGIRLNMPPGQGARLGRAMAESLCPRCLRPFTELDLTRWAADSGVSGDEDPGPPGVCYACLGQIEMVTPPPLDPES